MRRPEGVTRQLEGLPVVISARRNAPSGCAEEVPTVRETGR